MDTLQYRDIFISESLEHLDHLNTSLLALEKNPADRPSLNEIFRTSHTLKGMAATMGFDQITELTHQMENVLDRLRSSEGQVTPEVVDVLFECLDALAVLVEEISTSEPKNIELAPLLDKLRDLEGAFQGKLPAQPAKPKKAPQPAPSPASGTTAAPSPPVHRPAAADDDLSPEYLEETIHKAEAEGYVAYGVHVKLVDDCAFKGVRAFMVHKLLAEQGEIIATVPESKRLQEGEFESEFLILVLSKRGKDILSRGMRAISEIASFDITEVQVGNLEAFFGEHKPAVRSLPTAPTAALDLKSRPVGNRLVQSIRVSIERLDNLQNLVGELVINKIRLTQISKQYELKDLKEALAQFDRITNELQDEVTEVRMVPMEHIFNRFPRMVRDLAKEGGKEIELEMEGKEIELDRTVLDEINDPLVHLLRNAVDHGIEPPEQRLAAGKGRSGLIRLAASREKNHVIIQVVDDGRGIDPVQIRRVAVERGVMGPEEADRLTDQEAVNLIALPGFTTATTVTEVSGRGVGVDAVRSKIESFGGSLRIESEPGSGSTFVLRMPMTLAIIQALLVRVGLEVYSIPVINTVETIEFDAKDLKHVQQGEVVMYRDSVLPLLRLDQALEVPRENDGARPGQSVLVTEVGETRVGLMVDEVLGQQEIAIKSLGPLLKGIRGFSGVTILGDGRISLVLDVPSLI